MRMVALLSDAAFDSEDTELLGAAFEAAWEKLTTAGSALAEDSQAALTRELLAKRIIELAKRGERDPDPRAKGVLNHRQKPKAPGASELEQKPAALSRATPGR